MRIALLDDQNTITNIIEADELFTQSLACSWVDAEQYTGLCIGDPLIEPISNLVTSKLTELSAACSSAIIGGVDVETLQGIEHFSLTTEDQINLQNLMFQVASGAVSVPYHADGDKCRAFTAEEISAVSFSAVAHKTYHTTYYNYLKAWVNRTDNPDELNSIYYGAELPQDLAESMTALISSVGGVIG